MGGYQGRVGCEQRGVFPVRQVLGRRNAGNWLFNFMYFAHYKHVAILN